MEWKFRLLVAGSVGVHVSLLCLALFASGPALVVAGWAVGAVIGWKLSDRPSGFGRDDNRLFMREVDNAVKRAFEFRDSPIGQSLDKQRRERVEAEAKKAIAEDPNYD